MIKWINKRDKKWNCEHVNKNDVLIEKDGELFFYLTDYPEPTGEYKYVFVSDLLENQFFNNRIYDPCDCQPERSKREDSQQCEMRCSEHCGNTMRDK